MAHQANPTHLPPPKSPREYEAEIARLKDENEGLRGDYAVLRRALVTVTMDRGYDDLFDSTTDRVARVLRNKPESPK